MTGPKLTQHKIDKLRDGIHVVKECVVDEDPTSVQIRLALASALTACDVLEILLDVRPVENVRTERV